MKMIMRHEKLTSFLTELNLHDSYNILIVDENGDALVHETNLIREFSAINTKRKNMLDKIKKEYYDYFTVLDYVKLLHGNSDDYANTHNKFYYDIEYNYQFSPDLFTDANQERFIIIETTHNDSHKTLNTIHRVDDDCELLGYGRYVTISVKLYYDDNAEYECLRFYVTSADDLNMSFNYNVTTLDEYNKMYLECVKYLRNVKDLPSITEFEKYWRVLNVVEFDYN